MTSASQGTYGHGMGRGWSQRRLRAQAVDRLIAAGLGGWALFDVPWWWRPPGHGGSGLAILAIAGLAIAQSLPFLWRRQRPAAVLALTAAALVVKYGTHLNLWSSSAAVLAAAYGLGAYGRQPARRTARLLAVAAVLAAIISLQADRDSHSAAIACALFCTALVLGEVTASHRDVAASAAQHAHELERAVLAREVHDVVAHQLSAIAVQAGAARFAAAEDPQVAVTAVAAIEQGARDGLAELNTLVRRLRQNGTADQRGGGQPRLEDVGGLIERAARAGLRAELLVDGQARPLTEAVELAGYRVIQESLTNAIRHAGRTAATVRLRYRADGVMIEVADDGPAGLADGAVSPGGGAGLAGLSERAKLLGGQLEAGQGQRGFIVRAFLPSPP